MKKLVHKTFLAFTTVLAFENSYGQDPVCPSMAVNPANPLFNINGVSYLNPDTAVAVGANGTAWTSIDGGLNWSIITTFTSTANNNAVYWEDNYICVAGDAGTVTFSADKGLSWKNAAQAQPTINYHGVDFADTTFGISVGDAGDAVVYKWNGILDWVHIPTGLTSKLNAVSCYKTSSNIFVDGNAIAVGDNGAVATYASGSWTTLTNTITTNLNGIYLFPDHTTALVVGDNGLIMRTPDYGNTWNILNYGTTEALNGISEGVTDAQIIAVGDSGVIYVSADTGNTFTRYTVGFNTTNLKGVSAKNPRGSFGGSGNTLRYFTSDTTSTNAGIINNKETTSTIGVSPNPACNSLTITAPYDLNTYAAQLYNSMGVKVRFDHIKAGINQCDVSHLDSGIYFLVIGKYTRKIVIVK